MLEPKKDTPKSKDKEEATSEVRQKNQEPQSTETKTKATVQKINQHEKAELCPRCKDDIKPKKNN